MENFWVALAVLAAIIFLAYRFVRSANRCGGCADCPLRKDCASEKKSSKNFRASEEDSCRSDENDRP